MQPAVTVIMPVWNAEASLRKSVQSVLVQTLQDWELLLIDDGSTDGTAAIMAEMQAQDMRIRVLHQENQGPGPARNRGMDEATGRFCFFLDADDCLAAPDVLERLHCHALEAYVAICGGGLMMEDAGRLLAHPEVEMQFSCSGLRQYRDWQYDYGFYRFLYNRDFLCRKGIRFPALLRYEDPAFFVQSLTLAEEFYAVPEIVYCWHRHDILWNLTKVVDLLSGLTHVARFAQAHQLGGLWRRQQVRLLTEYKAVIQQQLCSEARLRVAKYLVSCTEAMGQPDDALLQQFGMNMCDMLALCHVGAVAA